MNRRIIAILSMIIILLSMSITALAVSEDGIGNGIPSGPNDNKPVPSKEEGLLNDIKNGIGGLASSMGDVAGSVVTGVINKISEIVNDTVGKVIISNITFYLNAFVSFVKQGDPVFSDTTVNNIYSLVKPVAYSLVALFFVMGLAKNAMYFEIMSFEVVLKSAVMLVIGKYLVDTGIWILQIICGLNSYVSTLILNNADTDITSLYNLNGSYSSAVAGASTGVQAISSGILFFIFAVIALLSAVAIFIVLILRQIHLGVLVCLSPLFFSTIVADISNDVFKSFIKHFFAVAFQTTFMSVALALFCGSMRSFLSGSSVGMGGGFIGMLVGIIGLSFYMVKTPGTINGILGVGANGNGINVASIAALFV